MTDSTEPTEELAPTALDAEVSSERTVKISDVDPSAPTPRPPSRVAAVTKRAVRAVLDATWGERLGFGALGLCACLMLLAFGVGIWQITMTERDMQNAMSVGASSAIAQGRIAPPGVLDVHAVIVGVDTARGTTRGSSDSGPDLLVRMTALRVDEADLRRQVDNASLQFGGVVGSSGAVAGAGPVPTVVPTDSAGAIGTDGSVDPVVSAVDGTGAGDPVAGAGGPVAGATSATGASDGAAAATAVAPAPSPVAGDQSAASNAKAVAARLDRHFPMMISVVVRRSSAPAGSLRVRVTRGGCYGIERGKPIAATQYPDVVLPQVRSGAGTQAVSATFLADSNLITLVDHAAVVIDADSTVVDCVPLASAEAITRPNDSRGGRYQRVMEMLRGCGMGSSLAPGANGTVAAIDPAMWTNATCAAQARALRGERVSDVRCAFVDEGLDPAIDNAPCRMFDPDSLGVGREWGTLLSSPGLGAGSQVSVCAGPCSTPEAARAAAAGAGATSAQEVPAAPAVESTNSDGTTDLVVPSGQPAEPTVVPVP